MKKIIKTLIPFCLIIPSFFIRNNDIKQLEATSSYPISSIPLLQGEEFDYAHEKFDGFDNGIDRGSWWLNKKQWANKEDTEHPEKSRANGGVMPENVFYDSSKGTVILRTAGDYYAEKEIRTPTGSRTIDGRRSGGDLVSKFFTYPGRYEVRMKVAPRYGVCSSLWTYVEYGEYIRSEEHTSELQSQ